MSILSPHDEALNGAHVRALAIGMGGAYDGLPPSSVMAALSKHGGLYSLLDHELLTARIAPMIDRYNKQQHVENVSQVNSASIASSIGQQAASFFYHLAGGPAYGIPSDLISYLTFPRDGRMYETTPHFSTRIPAAFTFVGQFIDHDLTMNGMDLFVDQTNAVPSGASPLIDLDSVYGPRSTSAAAPNPVFDADGFFLLTPIEGTTKSDVPRKNGTAIIVDPRNDENQLVLQIHILIMEAHNKYLRTATGLPAGRDARIAAARKEVVATWRSVVFYDYLKEILLGGVRDQIVGQIDVRARTYGKLKHQPYRELATGRNVVFMPHEFAIGFRFGHSQLRPFYTLNEGPEVNLFDRRVQLSEDGTRLSQQDDLRGGRPLSQSHVINWNVFYPDESMPDKSNSLLIDGQITPPVFDLPESAIPDDIKYIGNLAQRNLIRSRLIGLVSGETLAQAYGIPALSSLEIEPDESAHSYFMHDAISKEVGPFRTPLWYYILREAEVRQHGDSLGELGSHLIGEVILGAMYYDDDDTFDPKHVSELTGKAENTLHDLVMYVYGTAG